LQVNLNSYSTALIQQLANAIQSVGILHQHSSTGILFTYSNNISKSSPYNLRHQQYGRLHFLMCTGTSSENIATFSFTTRETIYKQPCIETWEKSDSGKS